MQDLIGSNLEILKLQSDNAEAMVELAKAYWSVGNYSQAIIHAKKSVLHKPTDWMWIDSVITAFMNPNCNYHNEALEVLDSVISRLDTIKHTIPNTELNQIQTLYRRRALVKQYLSRYEDYIEDLINIIVIACANHIQFIDLIDHILGCCNFYGYCIQNYVNVQQTVTLLNGLQPHSFVNSPIPSYFMDPDFVLTGLLLYLFPFAHGYLPGHTFIINFNEREFAQKDAASAFFEIAKAFETDPVKCSKFLNATPMRSISLLLLYMSIAAYPTTEAFLLLAEVLTKISDSVTMGQEILDGPNLALKFLYKAVLLDQNNPDIYMAMADIYWRQNNLIEATFIYQKIYGRNKPHDDEITRRYVLGCNVTGEKCRSEGRWEEALKLFETAYTINSDNTDALTFYSQALNSVCDWSKRGGVGVFYVDQGNTLMFSNIPKKVGMMGKVSDVVDNFIKEGAKFGDGVIQRFGGLHKLFNSLCVGLNTDDTCYKWLKARADLIVATKNPPSLKNEGGFILRLINKLTRRVQRRWYLEFYGNQVIATSPQPAICKNVKYGDKYLRPKVPPGLPQPSPSPVQPWYTFTYDLSPKQIRLVSHRQALHIAYDAFTANWLPETSVFELHNRQHFEVYVYALNPDDGSLYRAKIVAGCDHFRDCSGSSTKDICDQIIQDGIHILLNLNGYTAGDRNHIFAARPAPIQMQHMGFAGTMGGLWTDYNIVDDMIVPSMLTNEEAYKRKVKHHVGDICEELDPEDDDDNIWVYPEKTLSLPDTYFVNDHKQGFRDDLHIRGTVFATRLDIQWTLEEDKRWKMRQQLFPNIPDDWVIFANFNQLYKIDPVIFKVWLEILEQVPNSILWLLKFPADGAKNLYNTAVQWAGVGVASRIHFTEIAGKHDHILRGRVADLVLDTPQVNAHTTACDILWSGTPILTLCGNDHKWCSRVAASICKSTGFGDKMIAKDHADYERRAIELARSVRYNYWQPNPHFMPPQVHRSGFGELVELRKKIFLNRDNMRLFDTQRIVANLEKGYAMAWELWVTDNEKNIKVV
ncbi:13154_t:CDS:2 [Funneliformis caledonium]|uniref:protein O-GlcNAc transferase n=1 Tax=Funneliformis caledonium TaxID=1117310 RepID=A0A9N9G1E2_9GLOM|nr:13154_t:CDS:2 [Funneliformis caledonium]